MQNDNDVVLGNYLCQQGFECRNIYIFMYTMKGENILQDRVEWTVFVNVAIVIVQIIQFWVIVFRKHCKENEE